MDPIFYTSWPLLLDAATPSVPSPPAPDLEGARSFHQVCFSFTESSLSSLCACRLLSLLHRRCALQRGRAEVMVSRVFPERFNGSRCAIILELEVDSGRKNSRERTKFCWSGADAYSRGEYPVYIATDPPP